MDLETKKLINELRVIWHEMDELTNTLHGGIETAEGELRVMLNHTATTLEIITNIFEERKERELRS